MGYHRVPKRQSLRHHYSLNISQEEEEVVRELMKERGLKNKGELLRTSIEAYAGKPIFRERTGGKRKQ